MRLIDADALIEKAWDADTRVGYVQVVDVGDIKDAPTIEPEPNWIPCSERLPEIGMDILICDIDGDIYLTHMTRYKEFYDYFGNRVKNVRAWQKLPEPYKEGEQDG